MDTVRVNIGYRPLRIAWAIHSGDQESFRRVVRLSHILQGGRFNPIVLVDHKEEANRLIELFRADLVLPIGESEEVKTFPTRYPHLFHPHLADSPIDIAISGEKGVKLLDIDNALVHWHETPEWKTVCDKGLLRLVWDADDPLSDVFLMRYGAYPVPEEVGTDYLDLLRHAAPVTDLHIDKSLPLDPVVTDHPSLGYLSSHGLHRVYSVRSGWDDPGFFVGAADNIDDLVCFWNLCATDNAFQFVDFNHEARLAAIIPKYRRWLEGTLPQRGRHMGAWSRPHLQDVTRKRFGGEGLIVRTVSDTAWNGQNIRPPMVYLAEESALGVLSQERGLSPRASFAFGNKPISGDPWFDHQHLVASVKFIGLFSEKYAFTEQYTFEPPYVPELNKFLGQAMDFFPRGALRSEPERIGLLIQAGEDDAFLRAVPVSALIEQIFDLAGFRSSVSRAGLITRQLISRLAGVQGARVFKIPGVRRLLKTYGPTATFTQRSALQLIGSKNPSNPQARFCDHRHLPIEPRAYKADLTPTSVFTYLVEKGLFHIGAELTCPACGLASWIALDALKQSNVCELCGVSFDATRQLVAGEFHYRRTGVLGRERNIQGAVPVVLAMQQLENNLEGNLIYTVSHDLEPKGDRTLPVCEIDFLILRARTYPDKTIVMLGEAKDEGGTFNAGHIENLRQVADALPAHRFETFMVLAKLAPFTEEEIELAKMLNVLNGEYRQRVIMLTARDLEPMDIYQYQRRKIDYRGTAEELASLTARIYFNADQCNGADEQMP
jgi:hypothetical protein